LNSKTRSTDINRVVADPFQFRCDFGSCGYQTKIVRGWLIECKQTDASFIGVNIQPIDLNITRNRLAGFDGISVYQCFNGPHDLHLNQRAHFK
jgi:hypothetical protein